MADDFYDQANGKHFSLMTELTGLVIKKKKKHRWIDNPQAAKRILQRGKE